MSGDRGPGNGESGERGAGDPPPGDRGSGDPTSAGRGSDDGVAEGAAGRRDLAVVAATAVLAALSVLVPGVRDSGLRALGGITLALVTPGYAVVAAVLPDRADLDAVERVGLGVAASLVLAMALGILGGAVLELGRGATAATLAAVTVLGCGVAAARRGTGSATGQADGPGRESPGPAGLALREAWPGDRSRRGIALDLGIALAVVVALAGVGYLVAVPKPHAGYAALSLQSGDTPGPDAAGYPETLSSGESASVVVAVDHRRPDPGEYAVVVVLQRVAGHPDGSATGDPGDGSATNASGDDPAVVVRSERVLRTERLRLGPGERWTVEPSFAPPEPGRYRLVARLYREDPGGTPRHSVHLWIDVRAANATGAVPDGVEPLPGRPGEGDWSVGGPGVGSPRVAGGRS